MARNENGEVLKAHVFKAYIFDPKIVELMAMKKAILVSLENGWKNIICESYAQAIIHYLNGRSTKELYWLMKSMFKEISELCNAFDNINFVWYNRSLTLCVHLLAKWAANHDFVSLLR